MLNNHDLNNNLNNRDYELCHNGAVVTLQNRHKTKINIHYYSKIVALQKNITLFKKKSKKTPTFYTKYAI